MTNLGASFAWLGSQVDSKSIEKRFVALLNCHEDDLAEHLRHAIGLLRSKEIPVDWIQLLKDLRNWNHPDTTWRVMAYEEERGIEDKNLAYSEAARFVLSSDRLRLPVARVSRNSSNARRAIIP